MHVTYARRHILLQWGGRLGSSGEIWQCGLRLWSSWISSAPLQVTETAAAQYLPDYADMIAMWHQAPASHLSRAARLSWVRMHAVGTDGAKAGNRDRNTVSFDPELRGYVDALPFQCALTCSLVTQETRGRAHIGRILLPIGTSAPVSEDTGQLPNDMAQYVAQGVADLLRDIGEHDTWMVGGMLSDSPDTYVFSAIDGSAMNFVRAVRVGQIVDTLRQRRRHLDEEPAARIELWP